MTFGERRAPMRRGAGPKRKAPMPRVSPAGRKPAKAAPKAAPKAKATPVPEALRSLALARATVDGVVRCDCCGQPIGWGGYSAHHRDARGMGGSSRGNPHTAANVIVLAGSGTTLCHGRVESERSWSYARGLLIRGEVALPETTPMLRHGVSWVIPSLEGWVSAEPLEWQQAA